MKIKFDGSETLKSLFSLEIFIYYVWAVHLIFQILSADLMNIMKALESNIRKLMGNYVHLDITFQLCMLRHRQQYIWPLIKIYNK